MNPIRLVLCDCCGVQRVAVPLAFEGHDFVWCESCGGDLASAGSLEVVDAEHFASDVLGDEPVRRAS